MSLKTLQCYAVLLVARLTSILRYEGYLPYDRSGDFVYQVCEATTLVAVVGLIAALLTTHARSYDARKDRFGAGLGLDAVLPPAAGAALLAAPALLLALVLHPSLNNNWATDTAWAFALYLEAVAVVPQLFMFSSAMASAAAEVEPFEANFVFAIAAGRACQFVFWLSSFRELNDKYAAHYSRAYPGHLVVLSQVVNLLLLADYVYFYLSASRRREGFILPSSI